MNIQLSLVWTIALALALPAAAQNLIPNGDFSNSDILADWTPALIAPNTSRVRVDNLNDAPHVGTVVVDGELVLNSDVGNLRNGALLQVIPVTSGETYRMSVKWRSETGMIDQSWVEIKWVDLSDAEAAEINNPSGFPFDVLATKTISNARENVVYKRSVDNSGVQPSQAHIDNGDVPATMVPSDGPWDETLSHQSEIYENYSPFPNAHSKDFNPAEATTNNILVGIMWGKSAGAMGTPYPHVAIDEIILSKVPEPSSAILVLLAVGCLSLARRHSYRFLREAPPCAEN